MSLDPLPVLGAVVPFLWTDGAGDDVAFSVLGDAEQLLQVTLGGLRSMRAEPAAIAFMSSSVVVSKSGLLTLLGHVLAGESASQNTLSNVSHAPAVVGLRPKLPHAKLVPLDLRKLGSILVCRDAFLASLGSVSLSARPVLRVVLFGGESVYLQRLSGTGLAFISASGALVQKRLREGEVLLLDDGVLVAVQETVSLRPAWVGSLPRMLLGGESPFMVQCSGPGLVLMQSGRRRGGWRSLGGRIMPLISSAITLGLLLL